MAPCEITDDYYAILEVSQTAPLDIIRRSYLRLVLLRHPDKNTNKADATTAFQCLATAYETISDPEKRKIYDLQWERIKHRQNTEQEARKRQAEAAEAERKRAAEERSNRQKEQRASQECLQQLEKLRASLDSRIFELNREIRRLTADVKRLQEQDDEESRKARERNSWWAYLTSPVYGSKVQETAEQKQQRDHERHQRQASRRIKGSEVGQKEARLQSLKSALQGVDARIAAERKKIEDEARAQRQEKLRKEQEARRQFEERQQRERYAKWQAEAAQEARERAQAAKEAREAEAAAKEEARKVQAAREEARKAREAAAAAARKRFSKPAAPAPPFPNPSSSSSSHQRASTSNSSSNYKKPCRHSAFWPKLEGSHLCSHCNTIQRRFAFQCPGCKMVACASCRQSLRNEKMRKTDRDPWETRFDADAYYYDEPYMSDF